MKCFCFHVHFDKELSSKQQDIFISFFQRAIEEATSKAKQMTKTAKSLPLVGNSKHAMMLDTMNNYVSIQAKFMALHKSDAKKYVFVMPSMKREIARLKGWGLNFPDIRVGVIKRALEENVFPEMKIRGMVVVLEEEKILGEELYDEG